MSCLCSTNNKWIFSDGLRALVGLVEAADAAIRQNAGREPVEGRLTLSGRAPASWRNPNRLSLALLNGQPLHDVVLSSGELY